MIEVIVIIGLILLFLHLLGGCFRHRRHYNRHGMHPNLWWNYRRGWFGSVRVPLIGGRYSHHL